MSRYVDRSVADDERFTGMDVEQPYYIQRLEEVSIGFLLKYSVK